MVRSTAFASFALLAALAAAPPAVRADGGNVVGGGAATITGGGDDMVITYSTGGAGGGGALRAQTGRSARMDAGEVAYLTTAAAPSGPGREAWLVGGGDNAEVVYVRPR